MEPEPDPLRTPCGVCFPSADPSESCHWPVSRHGGAEFANILKTGQFWPKVTVPKKISRPLWALFLLSAVSVCWSQEPFLSAYNWIVVVGLKAGSFYFVLRYGSTGRRSLFLVKVFMVSAGLVALYGIYQYFLVSLPSRMRNGSITPRSRS